MTTPAEKNKFVKIHFELPRKNAEEKEDNGETIATYLDESLLTFEVRAAQNTNM